MGHLICGLLFLTILTSGCAPYVEVRFRQFDCSAKPEGDSIVALSCYPATVKRIGGVFYITRIRITAEEKEKTVEKIILQSIHARIEQVRSVEIDLHEQEFSLGVRGQGINTRYYGFLNVHSEIAVPVSSGVGSDVTFFTKVRILNIDGSLTDTVFFNSYRAEKKSGWYPILTH